MASLILSRNDKFPVDHSLEIHELLGAERHLAEGASPIVWLVMAPLVLTTASEEVSTRHQDAPVAAVFAVILAGCLAVSFAQICDSDVLLQADEAEGDWRGLLAGSVDPVAEGLVVGRCDANRRWWWYLGTVVFS